MTAIAPDIFGGSRREPPKTSRTRNDGSTLQTRMQKAVCVRGAYKRYGSKKNYCVILDGLNMTVTKGDIYGLLGSSGCGKTTLLNCIVGRKTLNSGDIWVLGGRPGTKKSAIPGPRLGYMPQEIALYGECTIHETLQYFGTVTGMQKSKMETRIDFLAKLLMLPNVTRMVSTLSGGQQRRVSLSAALVHEPELLILDEPTVGVDPLLRQTIWDYLVNITKGGRSTVIITTHYIDETRQATKIGLMRGGYFLAEESPKKLLSTFGCETLEGVFLKLSVIQNLARRRGPSIAQEITQPLMALRGGTVRTLSNESDADASFGENLSSEDIRRISTSSGEDEDDDMSPDKTPSNHTHHYNLLNPHHMRALIWKDCLWFWRNVPIMCFIFGLPVCQIALFCAAIGHEPLELRVSVVNHELKVNETCYANLHCNNTRLSCDYLGYLEKRGSLVFRDYDSEEEARTTISRGKAHAAMMFKANYSLALRARVEDGHRVKNDDLLTSTVDIVRDVSNKHNALYLMMCFYESFLDFIQDYTQSCGYSRKLLTIPVRINKPVYGTATPNFTDFAAPGVVITTIFFLSAALTSLIMLSEKNEGTLERSLVIGISSSELLFAHATILFVIMSIQTTSVLICAFVVSGLKMEGPLILVIISSMLTGTLGMSFGFAVGCSFDTERTATYAMMGTLLPMMLLCGIIWPVEGMHSFLKKLSVVLPLTKPTEGMRAVLAKGWELSNETVYLGFVTSVVWIIIYLTLSVLVLKLKNG